MEPIPLEGYSPGAFSVLFLGLWIFKTEIEHLNFYGKGW